MNRIIKITFFFIVISICLGCPDRYDSTPDSSITITNNSGKDLLVDFSVKKNLDTTLNKYQNFLDTSFYNRYLIKKNTSKSYPDLWRTSFKNNSYLVLFVFSRDTIDMVAWEKVLKEYKILRRYDLTEKKLDSLNWTITYP